MTIEALNQPNDDEASYLAAMYEERLRYANWHYELGRSIGRMQRLTDEMTEIADSVSDVDIYSPEAIKERRNWPIPF